MEKFMQIYRIAPSTKEMLAEIVRVKIEKDFSKAEKYDLDIFVLKDGMQIIVSKLLKIDKELNDH